MIPTQFARHGPARWIVLATMWLCAALAIGAALGLILNVCRIMVLWGDCSVVDKGVSVAVTDGVFSIAFNDINLECMSNHPASWVPSFARSGSSHVDWLRFVFWRRGFDLPLWTIAFALGVPAIVLRRIARRSPESGTCPTCGYNLFGLPAASPCPECGAVR